MPLELKTPIYKIMQCKKLSEIKKKHTFITFNFQKPFLRRNFN